MPAKSFEVKFSLEINSNGYHKKITVGIEPGPFPDPRRVLATSYTRNGIEKIRRESMTNISELNKQFGIRLKQFIGRAFR
jgi:hypothetical protein